MRKAEVKYIKKEDVGTIKDLVVRAHDEKCYYAGIDEDGDLIVFAGRGIILRDQESILNKLKKLGEL